LMSGWFWVLLLCCSAKGDPPSIEEASRGGCIWMNELTRYNGTVYLRYNQAPAPNRQTVSRIQNQFLASFVSRRLISKPPPLVFSSTYVVSMMRRFSWMILQHPVSQHSLQSKQ